MNKFNMLIIDDSELNTSILKEIFEDEYNIDAALDGSEALNYITFADKYDVILLDLLMPIMDGFQFLKKIRTDYPDLSTPIIVITSDDAINDQKKVFELGVSDFIIKPFESDIVYHRVNNSVSSYQRLKTILNQKIIIETEAYRDALTKLYNRGKSESLINDYLSKNPNEKCALVMYDVDNFKLVNDLEGHQVGDRTLQVIANLMLSQFKDDDIVARFGGDEFIIFIKNVKNDKDVTTKVSGLNRFLHFNPNVTIPANITLSAGICFGCGKTFIQMYKEADEALFVSKENGKNTYTVYGENIDVNSIISHHDKNIFCISRNRVVHELLSSISINKYGYILLGSLQELDLIKDEFRTKKCILIVDISLYDNYNDVLEYLKTKEPLFPLVGITKEANVEQIFAFNNTNVSDLITYPISKDKLQKRIDNVFINKYVD